MPFPVSQSQDFSAGVPAPRRCGYCMCPVGGAADCPSAKGHISSLPSPAVSIGTSVPGEACHLNIIRVDRLVHSKKLMCGNTVFYV